MERVLYDTIKIAVEKTKSNVITIKKDYSEYTQRIVKLPYTKVNIITGLAGPKGDDGAVFVPIIEDGRLSWELREGIPESPSSINMLANIDSISNVEIYNIINNGDL